MIDSEVERLRRLRASALQLRAVARALSNNQSTRNDVLLKQGGCAAWRVARVVTGRLRAHPNDRYQRDAGIVTLVKNAVTAAAIAFTASSRRQSMSDYGMQLKTVMRQLTDVRALTWAADLSETFGRSQREIRVLMDAVHCETHDCGGNAALRGGRHAAVSVQDDSPFLTI